MPTSPKKVHTLFCENKTLYCIRFNTLLEYYLFPCIKYSVKHKVHQVQRKPVFRNVNVIKIDENFPEL